MIYVTVGVSRGFERLVRAADDVAADLEESVLIQTGDTAVTPRRARSVDTVPKASHEEHVRAATCVVGHAGTGTLLTAVDQRARLVLFPRNPGTDEVFDDHQLRNARAWTEAFDLPVATDRTELAALLERPGAVPRPAADPAPDFPETVASVVREEAERR